KDNKADPIARGFAALALVRVGPTEATTASEAFAETLSDPKAPASVREASARLLGQLGRAASTAVPALAKAIENDGNMEVGRAAAGWLAQLGPDAKEAMPVLKQAIKDPDKTVRCHAIYAVGGLGRDGAVLVKELLACMKENQVEVRVAAIRALGGIGP